jgi:hypothetical protein
VHLQCSKGQELKATAESTKFEGTWLAATRIIEEMSLQLEKQHLV